MIFCTNAIVRVWPNAREGGPVKFARDDGRACLATPESRRPRAETAQGACGVTVRHFAGVLSNMAEITGDDDRETGRPQFGTRNLPHDGNVFQHNAWYVAVPCAYAAACDVRSVVRSCACPTRSKRTSKKSKENASY